MIPREKVVAEARSWAGTKWIHQGRNRHGIDCVGLIVVVCRSLEIWDYDVAAYPREPNGTFISHFIAAGGKRIPLPEAQDGDLLLFRDTIYACHVGFVASKYDQAHIIHAHTSRRKVIEEPMIGEWLSNRVAAIALPGVG